MTINAGICEDHFTREPGLSLAQFDVYLADFPYLEAAGCESPITESEIWETMELVGRGKTPGLDGLPYKLYLRQSPNFVPLLALIYNNWIKQRSIPQHFTRGLYHNVLPRV